MSRDRCSMVALLGATIKGWERGESSAEDISLLVGSGSNVTDTCSPPILLGFLEVVGGEDIEAAVEE